MNNVIGDDMWCCSFFFGEHFNLIQGSQRGSTSAIQYWTDEKIKELANTERKSVRGLLYGEKGSDVVSGKDERINVDSLDPELKQLRARLMKRIEESHQRLMNMVDEELLKVHIPREADGKRKGKAPAETLASIVSGSEDDDEEERQHAGETSEAVQKNDGGSDGESSEEKEKDDEGSDDETRGGGGGQGER
ncbi:uncharacterized protein LOC114743173 [Neltuma alba]|uniref:uncharacterized protein LOC114743173 n=1 Tax=Neltuma alba TaxID=207710 RepID=UPI0010A54FA1|nr:uncharacterized protein LOC114743173 [Prosopis alba]